MDEKTFHEKLLDLIEQIKRFPEAKRESLEMLAGELGKKYEDLRKSLVMLQDTLDSLRLNVKYLLFDLEATKKENIALRTNQHAAAGNQHDLVLLVDEHRGHHRPVGKFSERL